jgi:hypothetical protein
MALTTDQALPFLLFLCAAPISQTAFTPRFVQPPISRDDWPHTHVSTTHVAFGQPFRLASTVDRRSADTTRVRASGRRRHRRRRRTAAMESSAILDSDGEQLTRYVGQAGKRTTVIAHKRSIHSPASNKPVATNRSPVYLWQFATAATAAVVVS